MENPTRMSWNEPSPPPPPPIDRTARFVVLGSILAALITAGGSMVSSYLARPPQPVIVQAAPPAPVRLQAASVQQPQPLVSTESADERADTVYVTPSGKKYHRGTCRYARNGGAIGMSVADAIARGLGACRVCNP